MGGKENCLTESLQNIPLTHNLLVILPPNSQSPCYFDPYKVGRGLLSLWAACSQVYPPCHRPGTGKDVPAGDSTIYREPGRCKCIVSNGQWKGGKNSHKNKGERVLALCSLQAARMLIKTLLRQGGR